MKSPKQGNTVDVVNRDEHNDDAVVAPAEFELLLQQCGTRKYATVIATRLIASVTKGLDPLIQSYWDNAALRVLVPVLVAGHHDHATLHQLSIWTSDKYLRSSAEEILNAKATKEAIELSKQYRAFRTIIPADVVEYSFRIAHQAITQTMAQTQGAASRLGYHRV
jgi:hypothetical protein